MNARELREYSELHFGMRSPPDYWLSVPCGYCHSCQKSANNQYKIRLLYELRNQDPAKCLFITLTFNDENLARFSSDYNKAVRLFLDRLRKCYNRQIRHWIIGEFGSLRGRPHYHGILFDVPSELLDFGNVFHAGDHELLSRFWSYGFVFVGYVSDATCGYITKYLTKSINGKKIRPRIITSKGIGASYLDSDDAKLHKDGTALRPLMHINGFPQALPRYYYNKIFTDFDKENIALDRYISPPPFTWQGKIYFTEVSRDRARFNSYLQNLSLGLTPCEAPPSRRVERSDDRFCRSLNNVPLKDRFFDINFLKNGKI